MKKLLSVLAPLLIGAAGSAQGARPAAVPAQAEAFTLLYARPFLLEQPYTHTWREEAPQVRSGYVLVLQAELERIRPRQTLEPVLYAGAQTAERINAPRAAPGSASGVPGALGQLVVLVPAPLDAQGRVAFDPWKTPIFLGTPAFPEEVDAARVRLELARARRLGLGPPRRPKATAAARALARSPAPLRLPDRDALELELANLIERYSPAEVDLVRGMRVPRDQ